jgi:tRNA wybutosine-synthesizing protein 1
MLSQELRALLKRQHYALIGNNAAAKLCHWAKKAILGEGTCYKQQFYGIASHRCLQMTPCVSTCTHRCVFCWRAVDFTSATLSDADAPETVIEGALAAQKRLISGFGGVECDRQRYEEAHAPTNAAISLSGEPCAYPYLSELIAGFGKRSMSTFLVTNGTLPEALEALDTLPTQLYISLCAPDEDTYKRTHAPLLKDGWQRLNASLELMRQLRTRRCIRLTLVRGYNLHSPEKYARLIEKTDCEFVECKSYMHVGDSIKRLDAEHMPSFDEIKTFASALADALGYEVRDASEISRVALVAKPGVNAIIK